MTGAAERARYRYFTFFCRRSWQQEQIPFTSYPRHSSALSSFNCYKPRGRRGTVISIQPRRRAVVVLSDVCERSVGIESGANRYIEYMLLTRRPTAQCASSPTFVADYY
eukprot:GHVU01231047.1.p1 GENE.GHVU01231047.1~~GHVU01231047.1.p1  ORF type:complete len:109 (-),score=3.32 GHVU01231047.1:14-340(-)